MFITALMTLLLSSSCQPSVPYPQSVPSQQTLMTQSPRDLPFTLSASLLEVYEDRTAPPGSQPSHDRPVGHAVVRLRLENLVPDPMQIGIERVELHSAQGDQALITQEVEPIDLGGLQILERGFHLTNSQGFEDTASVKAIVVYQFNGSVYAAESPAVSVTVNR